jgi:4-hydroxybenzoate polyprenyltransferase
VAAAGRDAAGPAEADPGRQGRAGRARAWRGPWHPGTHLALLHAGPGLTVVVVGLAFGVVAGRHDPDRGRLGLLAVLLAANQYSAGALNDAVDAPADAATGRDKPIPGGAISRRAAATLAVAAGLVSLACGALLGPATLALAVAGLACAWGYDLWLKGTVASVLPFACALPLVPLFGYGAAGRFPAVLWWAWPIGALAAVAVHLADSLPDVEADRLAGVHGLAPRLGVRRAAALVVASYAATLALAAGSGLAAGDRPVVLAGTGASLVLAAAALAAGARGRPDDRRVAYRLLLAAVIALAVGWAAGVRP